MDHFNLPNPSEEKCEKYMVKLFAFHLIDVAGE
jgi:hypothetical protein